MSGSAFRAIKPKRRPTYRARDAGSVELEVGRVTSMLHVKLCAGPVPTGGFVSIIERDTARIDTSAGFDECGIRRRRSSNRVLREHLIDVGSIGRRGGVGVGHRRGA